MDLNILCNEVLLRIETLKDFDNIAEEQVTPPLEFQNIIGIVGQRGSGKSTLLQFVCKKLKEEGHFVSPIVRPEKVAPLQSLNEFVLAGISKHYEAMYRELNALPDKDKDEKLRQDVIEALRQLTRLSENNIRSSAKFQKNLDNSVDDDFFLSGSKQAAESSLKFDGIQLGKVLQTLFQLESTLHKPSESEDRLKSEDRFLIIPCDDCDSVPSLLPHFIFDMAKLSVPRIVILFAYNMEALRRAVATQVITPIKDINEMMKELHLSQDSDISSEIVNIIRKFSPESMRVYLPEANHPIERYEYFFLEEEEMLKNLLTKIILDGDEGITFRHLLDLSLYIKDAQVPIFTPLIHILPKSRRGLFNIHRLLQLIIKKSNKKKIDNFEDIKAVIHSLFNNNDLLPESIMDTIKQRMTWHTDNKITVDNRSIAVHPSLQNMTYIYEEGNISILVNRIVEYHANVNEGEAERKYAETHEHNIFSWMCLINELRTFNEEGRWESFPKPIGDFWDPIKLVINHERRPCALAMQPYHTSYIPYLLYDHLWSKLMTNLQTMNKNKPTPGTDHQRDLAGLVHLWLVCRIPFKDPIDVPQLFDNENNLDSAVSAWKKNVAEVVRMVIKDHNSKEKLYRWAFPLTLEYGMCFLHAASSFLFSDTQLQWLKQDIIPQFKPWYDESNENLLLQFFEKIINRCGKIDGERIFNDAKEAAKALDDQRAQEAITEKELQYKLRMAGFSVEPLLMGLQKANILTDKDIHDIMTHGLSPIHINKITIGTGDQADAILASLAGLIVPQSTASMNKAD